MRLIHSHRENPIDLVEFLRLIGWKGGRRYEIEPWMITGTQLLLLCVIRDAERN